MDMSVGFCDYSLYCDSRTIYNVDSDKSYTLTLFGEPPTLTEMCGLAPLVRYWNGSYLVVKHSGRELVDMSYLDIAEAESFVKTYAVSLSQYLH